jgi:hypothetical protein
MNILKNMLTNWLTQSYKNQASTTPKHRFPMQKFFMGQILLDTRRICMTLTYQSHNECRFVAFISDPIRLPDLSITDSKQMEPATTNTTLPFELYATFGG